MSVATVLFVAAVAVVVFLGVVGLGLWLLPFVVRLGAAVPR